MHSVAGFIRERWFLFSVIVFITLLTFIIYWRVISTAFIWDDYTHYQEVSTLGFNELGKIFVVWNERLCVRPLVALTLWVQFKLFGPNVVISHLISIGIHAAGAVSLFWFLDRLHIKRVPALLASVLFAVTPIATEPVIWSTVRFDILVAFLIILSLGLYAGFLKNGSLACYFGSLAALAGALLSKESAYIGVLLIFGLELSFTDLLSSREGENHLLSRLRRSIKNLWPFVFLTAGIVILRLAILSGVTNSPAEVPIMPSFNLSDGSLIVFYLLSPLNRFQFDLNTIIAMQTFLLVLIIIASNLIITRWKKADTTARRAFSFFCYFFVVSLLPVANMLFHDITGSNFRSSRFLYLATIPLLTLLCIALYEFGWKERLWHVAVVVTMVLLSFFFIYGQQGNSRAWIMTANTIDDISQQTIQIIPDPPSNAIFHYEVSDKHNPEFQDVNAQLTDSCGVGESVKLKYNRNDIQYDCFDKTLHNPDADFYFRFDRSSGELSLNSR
jgi:hypothetical protein